MRGTIRIRFLFWAVVFAALLGTHAIFFLSVPLDHSLIVDLIICDAFLLVLAVMASTAATRQISGPLSYFSAALEHLSTGSAWLRDLAQSAVQGKSELPLRPALGALPFVETAELRTLATQLSGILDSHQQQGDAIHTLSRSCESTRHALEQSRGRTRNIMESCLDPMILVRHDGTIAALNRAALLLLGIPDESSALKTPLARLFRNSDDIHLALDRARTLGSVRGVSALLDRASNHSRQALLSASLMEAEGGEPRQIQVILQDETESRTREEKIRQDLFYSRSLLEASIDPLFAISPEGRISDVNLETINKTGIPREQILGSDFVRLFTDPEQARRGYQLVLSEGTVRDFPLTMNHRNGTAIHVSFNASLYKDEGGRLLGIFAAARDISSAVQADQGREAKEWIMNGIAQLNRIFQEQARLSDMAARITTEITTYTGAQVGALYIQELEGASPGLILLASHAFTRRKSGVNRFLPGEGILGQAALEKKQILVSQIPQDYISISSGLGEAAPRNLCVTPLLFEGNVKGVLEIASFLPLTAPALEYLQHAAPTVASVVDASQAKERVAFALNQAQQYSTELEIQQKNLMNVNAELEEQTARLKQSEQMLQEQQNELERANAELQEQSAQLMITQQKLELQQRELEVTNSELSQKNDLLERQKADIELARKNLAAQAEEVTLASKYKSEFLANMSHELRTPLNSMLLLARLLRDNPTGNLSEEQVESANVIFESGSDLLNLINEILDLSKIEAGKMELRLEQVELPDFERAILSQFEPMARAQDLTLKVQIDPEAPPSIVTDSQRFGQVLKNLLGNALKFTEQGGVTVTFARPAAGVSLLRSGLDPARALAVHVTDTGIGIPAEKQKAIFEAFHQADSGDRRRFGGTGLGLSISRELVTLLGGEIQLESQLGKGSTFSVFIPLELKKGNAPLPARGHRSASVAVPAAATAPAPPNTTPARPNPEPVLPATARKVVKDDRDNIAEEDHVILIIEDDERFGNILAGQIRTRGFKCLLALTGEDGLELARQHRPDGVVLDIQLPGIDGWAVLNTLKQDVSLRHIPVHIVSVDEVSPQSMRIGAIGFAKKPITREQIEQVLTRLEAASAQAHKRVLVVEDDDLMRRETVRVITGENVTVCEVATGKEAMEALRSQAFNLVVMDLGLPDMQGLDLLKSLGDSKIALPPIIIHTVRELTVEEELFLRNYADSIIVKDVRSQERLIDEVALFLHRVVRDLPEENRRAILHLQESDELIRGKKVLIVEDDMRTMFAMARMLAGHGIHPLKAENGKRALEMLDSHPDVDLMLLDMMMPVMDGYETARNIRAQERFSRLPIVALTAKAMKEDRQKCLEAGATDYLTKPVDPDRLISLMRVLLCR